MEKDVKQERALLTQFAKKLDEQTREISEKVSQIQGMFNKIGFRFDALMPELTPTAQEYGGEEKKDTSTIYRDLKNCEYRLNDVMKDLDSLNEHMNQYL